MEGNAVVLDGERNFKAFGRFPRPLARLEVAREQGEGSKVAGSRLCATRVQAARLQGEGRGPGEFAAGCKAVCGKLQAAGF